VQQNHGTTIHRTPLRVRHGSPIAQRNDPIEGRIRCRTTHHTYTDDTRFARPLTTPRVPDPAKPCERRAAVMASRW
jgi:hypothetical protein